MRFRAVSKFLIVSLVVSGGLLFGCQAGAQNAQGDLAAIGYEDLVEHCASAGEWQIVSSE